MHAHFSVADMIKKTLLGIFTLASFYASAQTNSLLAQSFWKDQPSLATVKTAIANGNSPSEKNQMAMDPVVIALMNGSSTDVVKYLLDQKGNEPSKLTHDSRIYMHWAAMRGNDEIMAYLFEKGSKGDLEDSHGTTPFLFAAQAGQQNLKVYDVLQSHGVDAKKELNHDGANALLLAISADKDLKLTDYFVGKGLSLNSVDANGNNAFYYAARSGNIELLKKLVAKGVKPTDEAFIAATMAGMRRGPVQPAADQAKTDQTAIFKYLESLGLKPTVTNSMGQNVLHNIVRRPNSAALINYFIAKGVNVNQVDKEGNTPFLNAVAFNRDLAVIELLASKTKNINQANADGATALALAVAGNSAEVVNYLIEKGAKLDALDKKGDNLGAYLLQAYNPRRSDDFTEKLTSLQSKGFDFAKPQGDGSSLYHLAIVKGNLELTKQLAKLKIDINAKSKEGYTALQKAAMVAKDDATLKYLIAEGADKAAKTSFGETAYDLAQENESLSKKQVSITFLK